MRKPPQSKLASASLTAALKARVTLLQQENDELYTLLGTSTTGKLHEENKSLHKTVSTLETALRGAHKRVWQAVEKLILCFRILLFFQNHILL